jgi:hypothetical protein
VIIQILYLTHLGSCASAASVRFDFEACDSIELITTSVEALTFTDELNTIVDTTLDPVIANAPFLPPSFTDDLKASIVILAELKVNEVKAAIIAEISTLLGTCDRRRLEQMTLNEDGSQRMLQEDLNFAGIAKSIEAIDGVVSGRAHHMIIFLTS